MLEEGTPLYRAGFDSGNRADLREFFLLTDKPVMAVVNVAEDRVDDGLLQRHGRR